MRPKNGSVARCSARDMHSPHATANTTLQPRASIHRFITHNLSNEKSSEIAGQSLTSVELCFAVLEHTSRAGRPIQLNLEYCHERNNCFHQL